MTPSSGRDCNCARARRARTSGGTTIGGLDRIKSQSAPLAITRNAAPPATTQRPCCSQNVGGISARGGRKGGISSRSAGLVEAMEKHQTPSTRHQAPSQCERPLEFEAWNFSGKTPRGRFLVLFRLWSLEFEIFTLSPFPGGFQGIVPA